MSVPQTSIYKLYKNTKTKNLTEHNRIEKKKFVKKKFSKIILNSAQYHMIRLYLKTNKL